jgi:hypothetical protein
VAVQAGLSVWMWVAVAHGMLGGVVLLALVKVGAGIGVWF